MARGRDNVQIAAELGLAEQAVRNYVSRIYQSKMQRGESHHLQQTSYRCRLPVRYFPSA
jgi:predicted transcriptional regulator